MKLTSFLITIIIASVFITGFGLILADLNNKYTITDSGYDNSTLEVFNQLEGTYNLSVDIQDRVSNYETDRTLYDIVGGFLADARDTVKIAIGSSDFLLKMTNAGFEKLGIDPIFRTAFITIIIIITFLGILLSIVIGRDL